MDLIKASQDINMKLAQKYNEWIDTLELKEEDLKKQKEILESPEAKVDVRENFMAQQASDRCSQLQIDIRNLNNKIEEYNNFIKLEYTPTGYVTIGSTVELYLERDNRTFIVKLVPIDLGSALIGAVSIASGVGSAILGAIKGSSVKVKTLTGDLKYIVKEVY